MTGKPEKTPPPSSEASTTTDTGHGYLSRVQGVCPACRGRTLIVGAGGFITCSQAACPAPSAASEVLEAMA